MGEMPLATAWIESRGRWLAMSLLLSSAMAGGPARAEGKGRPATEGKSAPVRTNNRAPGTLGPDKEAAKLYEQGMTAVGAKQWEKAQAALLAAFKLKPHYQIAANLGWAELMVGKPRDAAEHLSFFLREAKDMSAADREEGENMLAQAKARIGTVTVRVDTEGAEVLVDGQRVGTSPLAGPVFVEPGHRTFAARSEGHAPVSQRIDVVAGAAPDVALTFVSTVKPVVERAPPSRAGVEPPSETGGSTWRTRVIVGSTGVAAVGLGVGVGFSIAAVAKNSSVFGEVERLAVQTEKNRPICPAREKDLRCGTLIELAKARSTYWNVAVGGFVVGGAAAAVALVATLWKPDRPDKSARGKPRLVIVPSPQGVLVNGTF